MKNENEKKKAKKIILLASIALTLSLVTGATFAFFYANLKGETINEIFLPDAMVTYTEPGVGIASTVMSEEQGLKSSNYFEFTVKGEASGRTAIEYAVYLNALEGNTISPSDVHVFLTDEHDVPVGKYNNYPNQTYKFMNTNPDSEYESAEFYETFDGEGFFEGITGKIFLRDGTSQNYGTMQPSITEAIDYFLKDKFSATDNSEVTFNVVDYYGSNGESRTCKGYTIGTSNINRLLDKETCTSEWEYIKSEAKSDTLGGSTSLGETTTVDNVVLEDSFQLNTQKSSETRTYRLRYWLDENAIQEIDTTTKEEITPTKEEDGQSAIFKANETFKFKVNVYARQAKANSEG